MPFSLTQNPPINDFSSQNIPLQMTGRPSLRCGLALYFDVQFNDILQTIIG